MSELPAEVEQQLAELSDEDFDALIRRVRPPEHQGSRLPTMAGRP